MYCLTVTYPRGEDTRFDFDYYRDTHIPLSARLLAKPRMSFGEIRLAD